LAKALFTVGYEHATAPAVLAELHRAKVDLLIDIRAVAASRRPGRAEQLFAPLSI
jgi:hypothetical protein